MCVLTGPGIIESVNGFTGTVENGYMFVTHDLCCAIMNDIWLYIWDNPVKNFWEGKHVQKSTSVVYTKALSAIPNADPPQTNAIQLRMN